jgi:3-polyprenyl-4-hydroxybenzoate decarboxylase and related decarboxylases
MRLPTPLIHDGDGGRYINTWGTIVARSPDGAWTNWSIARIMLRDRNTMVGIVSPQKHVGRVHAMWKAIGKPMPFALSLGQDPVVPFFAGMPLRDGVSEGPVIGGYVGEPIESFAAKPSTWTFRHPPRSSLRAISRSTRRRRKVRWPSTQATSYQARVNCGRCIVFRR